MANTAAIGSGFDAAREHRDRVWLEACEARIEGLERRLQAALDAANFEESRELRQQRVAARKALGTQTTAALAALDVFERELAKLGS